MRKNMNSPAKRLTTLALLLALIFILVLLERMLPPLPLLPPQFGRLGLSNVIVMYSLFFMGKKEAALLLFLKSLFALMMRGPFAALLSLTGGMLSVVLIILLLILFKNKISYIALSVVGAVGHNMGQLIIASLILQNMLLFLIYLPVLLIAGAVLGTVTGILLKILIPMFNKVYTGGDNG